MSDDQKKTIKFQMMMSPSEAEALDDWGFKRRIRSRAESIRRLCQVGITAQEKLPVLLDAIVAADADITKAFALQQEAIKSGDPRALLDSIVDIERTYLRNNVTLMRDIIETVVLSIFIGSGAGRIDEAIEFQENLKHTLSSMDKKSKEYHKFLVTLMGIASGRHKGSVEDLIEYLQESPQQEPSP